MIAVIQGSIVPIVFGHIVEVRRPVRDRDKFILIRLVIQIEDLCFDRIERIVLVFFAHDSQVGLRAHDRVLAVPVAFGVVVKVRIVEVVGVIVEVIAQIRVFEVFVKIVAEIVIVIRIVEIISEIIVEDRRAVPDRTCQMR